jgi:MYXO-CTERM domain-containing protein
MTIADATAAPVPAIGPWGLLAAAGGLGIIIRRRKQPKFFG